MADLIKNITYPFYLKGDDFKELSLKALPIKEWFDNNGQELAEFIYRHLNNYELNVYQYVNLKDVKSSISKVDFMFKEPLTLIENFKDKLNKIRTNIINLENYINNYRKEIKNNLINIQYTKQREIVETHKKEQFLEIKSMAKQEQELNIITSKFRKEKILVKDIEVIGIDNDFLENANQSELKQLIKYLIVDEKLVKNTIKAQWDTNTDNKVVGIKGINIQIKGVK